MTEIIRKGRGPGRFGKYQPGQVFGAWTLLARKRTGIWLARCGNCEAERDVLVKHLGGGKSRQCGVCARAVAGHKPKYGAVPTAKMPEYRTWAGMIERCRNPNAPHYECYGGRGISVCPEWVASYPAFFAHVGPRPTAGHSIDRIDVNGNYEPGNVRWATKTEQARNTRNTRWLTHDGETLSFAEWCERIGIGEATVRRRIELGWTTDRALTTPVRRAS